MAAHAQHDPPTQTATRALAAKASPIRDAYEELRAEGCDLQGTWSIRIPVVARLLRNVPFAEQGYVFSSEELSSAYGADGGWYQPNPDKQVTLDELDKTCVGRLKELEDRLRSEVSIPKDFEKLLTTDTDAVRKLFALEPTRKVAEGEEPMTTDHRVAFGPAPKLPGITTSESGLSYYACQPDTGCEALWFTCLENKPCYLFYLQD